MLGRKTGLYWRICWGIVTPILLIIIVLYKFITLKPLEYKEVAYPDAAIGKSIVHLINVNYI